LFFVVPVMVIACCNFIDRAKPPGSSAGLVIRFPLDIRLRLFDRRS